ncbi:MAG: Fic family protein [Gammaproteobacteria bacterium]|nr:Fic family protein [Gammaproteobacteria bacterium]
MDKSLFSHKSPGFLVPIKIDEKNSDWSFVPNPLPDKFNLDEETWHLLLKAKEELARLDGVGRHLPNQELLLRPLQQREALTSSSLEGTYASPEQLLLYGIDPREPSSDKDPVNSWREVFNYGRALMQGRQQIDEGYPLSLALVRQLHQSLLDGVRGSDRTPGEFRKTQVHIGSTRRFIPPPPIEVSRCLDEFEKHLAIESNIDPLVRCFLLHYQFETIHPFNDGNGRVGRLLLSLMIYKWCGLHSPWLYLSAYFERYKDEYINYLFNISTKADWGTWIKFCLRATEAQSIDSIRRIDSLVALRQDFHERTNALNGAARLHPIVENLFAQPLVMISQLARTYNVTYPTASSDILNLVNVGILKELPDTYPKTFFSPEIMRIAYRGIDEPEYLP